MESDASYEDLLLLLNTKLANDKSNDTPQCLWYAHAYLDKDQESYGLVIVPAVTTVDKHNDTTLHVAGTGWYKFYPYASATALDVAYNDLVNKIKDWWQWSLRNK